MFDSLQLNSCLHRTNHQTLKRWKSLLCQVIANYNWNDVLASAIRGIGWWAAPYVIFVHVAGGTILLNLLLAILIESFEENTQREQLLSGELRKKFLSAGERARMSTFAWTGFRLLRMTSLCFVIQMRVDKTLLDIFDQLHRFYGR